MLSGKGNKFPEEQVDWRRLLQLSWTDGILLNCTTIQRASQLNTFTPVGIKIIIIAEIGRVGEVKGEIMCQHRG